MGHSLDMTHPSRSPDFVHGNRQELVAARQPLGLLAETSLAACSLGVGPRDTVASALLGCTLSRFMPRTVLLHPGSAFTDTHRATITAFHIVPPRGADDEDMMAVSDQSTRSPSKQEKSGDAYLEAFHRPATGKPTCLSLFPY
jgi:hypothetical protein